MGRFLIMKTAILIFGMLREYEVTSSWPFQENLDCDYYLSTWNYSKYRYDDSPQEYREYIVTDELIKSLFPNIKYEILNENEIFNCDYTNTQSKMFYHWKNVYRLMLESNKKYDLIILTRPDIPIHIFIHTTIKDWNFNDSILYSDDLLKIRKKISNNSFDTETFEYLASDLFFCGSMKVFEKFMNSIPNINEDEFKYKDWTPHVDLANMLLSTELYPYDIHPFHVHYPWRPHTWQKIDENKNNN